MLLLLFVLLFLGLDFDTRWTLQMGLGVHSQSVSLRNKEFGWMTLHFSRLPEILKFKTIFCFLGRLNKY